MMKILDYIFYRSYLHFKKKDDSPMFTSVIVVSCFVITLTAPIWIGLMRLISLKLLEYFSQKFSIYSTCAAAIVYLLVYLAYRKRKLIIIEKYKNSRYNKMLSDKVFFTILALVWCILFYIVIILSDIVGHVIYENNLNGILDKYIQLL